LRISIHVHAAVMLVILVILAVLMTAHKQGGVFECAFPRPVPSAIPTANSQLPADPGRLVRGMRCV
jgi:hypothetical protein